MDEREDHLLRDALPLSRLLFVAFWLVFVVLTLGCDCGPADTPTAGLTETATPAIDMLIPLHASSRSPSDIGQLTWDTTHNADLLDFDANDAFWPPLESPTSDPPAWVPASTLARLHSGVFHWDFAIEHMQNAQIGVGFMLMLEEGVDWGFYGYLGAGRYAWAYDPSTGDVVNATQSIAGGLPVFDDGDRGTVRVLSLIHI